MSELEKKGLAQAMREALDAQVTRKRAPNSGFSFVRKFDSRRQDIAERHEELLWAGRK